MAAWLQWATVSFCGVADAGGSRGVRDREHRHLLAQTCRLDFIRFRGERSIVTHLAFFLPIAPTRTLLLQSGIVPDIGAVSLIVTIVGFAGSPFLIWRLPLVPRANFPFERPNAIWIAPKKQTLALQKAEWSAISASWPGQVRPRGICANPLLDTVIRRKNS